MARYWEIRESYGDRMRGGMMGRRDSEPMSEEEQEAYECGYEEGYEDAMKELQSPVAERRHMGSRMNMGEDYGLGERRGRTRMGRFR